MKRKAGWVERVLGRLVGRGLRRLAIMATRRDDAHEFAHLFMALKVGNTGPCDRGGECPLGVVVGSGDDFTIGEPKLSRGGARASAAWLRRQQRWFRDWATRPRK